MIRLIATAALAVSLLAPPALGQGMAPEAVQVEAVIRTFPEFSGVVLIARDGKPMFERAYDDANREWSVPNALDTKFRIGSMTKAFTAAAVMQLQEAGKLKVDDPVSKYIANTPATWQSITLRNLLNHTAGIARGLPKQGEIIRQDITPDQMVDLIRNQPMQFETGARRGYSNNGYVLLGKIIESLSGQSYADYVRDHIMEPAGMTSSGYDVTATILANRAAGYTVREAAFVNSSFVAMTLPYSAGGLYSTAGDLLRWDQALYGDKLLSAASRTEMFQDYGVEYGFGWEVRTKFGHRNISHGGGINGFSSWIERYPEDGLTVIVLSNIETTRTDVLADNLAALYLGVPARKAFAGGEAPIRRVMDGLRKGEVAANDLTPAGAEALKAQLATYQSNLAKLGVLRTIVLLGVDAAGMERYRMTYDNGVRDWMVQFDPTGKIIPMGAIDVPTSEK